MKNDDLTHEEYIESKCSERLAKFFCPWLDSENKPGTLEYAKDVQEMLAADGYFTEVVKEYGWYYVQPATQ